MNCPYCGQEMTKGCIQSSHAIHFVPDEIPMLYKGEPEDRFKVSANGILRAVLNGYSAESYYCPNCSKVITSVR